MLRISTFFKASLHSIVITTLTVIAIGYAMFRFDVVQQITCQWMTSQLRGLLHTDVQIESVEIVPLNQIMLNNVLIKDQHNDTLVYARRVMAAIEVSSLLHNTLEMSAIQFIDFDIRMLKAAPDSSYNFQFLIDALAPRNNERQREFLKDLKVNLVSLRRGQISHDITSEPHQKGFDINHLNIDNLSAGIALRISNKQSLEFRLKRLSMQERSGLMLHHCRFNFNIDNQKSCLSQLELRANDSHCSADTLMLMHNVLQLLKDSDEHFLAKSKNLVLNIVPKDLNILFPNSNNLNVPINLYTDIYCTNRKIASSNFDVTFTDNFRIHAQLALSHFSQNWRESYVSAQISELVSSPNATQSLFNDLWQWNSPEIVSLINNLGNIHFEGNCNGQLDSLTANGFIISDAGELQSELSIMSDWQSKNLKLVGDIQTNGFNLGQVINNKQKIGSVNGHIDINAEKQVGKNFHAYINSNIEQLELLNYTYNDIKANGEIDASSFNGNIDILTPHGNCRINGFLDLSDPKQTYQLDARLENIAPYTLNLTDYKPLDNATISCCIGSNFSCNNDKVYIGELFVDSISIVKDNAILYLDNIQISATEQVDGKHLAIESPFLSMHYQSNQDLKRLYDDFKETFLNKKMASRLSESAYENDQAESENHYRVAGVLHSTKDISQLLGLPFCIYNDIPFDGNMQTLQPQMSFHATCDSASLGDWKIVNNTISAFQEIGDSLLHVEYTGTCQNDNRSIITQLSASYLNDSIESNIAMHYSNGVNTLDGLFDVTALLNPLKVNLQTHEILLDSAAWSLSPIQIIQNDKHQYILDESILAHDDHKLTIAGQIDEHSNIDLQLHMNQIKLDRLFDLTNSNYLRFGGICTGDLSITTLENQMAFEADSLFIQDISYQRCILGDAFFTSSFASDAKKLNIYADILSNDTCHSIVSGDIKFAKRDTIDILFDANHLSVSFLRFWLNDIVQDLTGDAVGPIRLSGSTDKLTLVGQAKVYNGSFASNILGTSYNFEDSIYLTDKGLFFKDIRLSDYQNHECWFSMNISHNHFSNFGYDIDIDIPQRRDLTGILVYNKENSGNDLFWGKIYADGHCRMFNEGSEHHFLISGRTARDSRLYVSPNENNYSDNSYNFLSFRKKNNSLLTANQNQNYSISNNKSSAQSESSLYDLTLMVEATPMCQISVLMDPLAEDNLVCKGNGNLNIKYDNRHDVNLIGTYTIQQGKYTITMRNDLLSKDFKITDGSAISFTGNPANANLDIQAVYSIPSVNLSDLDESFSTASNLSRTTVPVDCEMKVTGELSSPQIAFDVEVQRVSSDIQAMVKNVIGTQEMMNRQIFYLLLFSRFYTPEYANTTQNRNGSGSELTSFASSTLTSQLNSLLGQMSNYFSLGTNIRTEKGDFSDMEMDLAISSQFLNNRLLVNGNFGYRDPANNTGLSNNQSSFIGDFDLEYLIKRNGSLRMKAYSHYNERDYSINNALTTQGIGIILRKDFKRFWDIFKQEKDHLQNKISN